MMINTHDGVIRHMNNSALCYGFADEENKRTTYFFFTDGARVDQSLVKTMMDQGYLRPKPGFLEGTDSQELEYKGGLI